jgi:hypothetical protein
MIRPHISIPDDPRLTTSDALEAFDRWNDGDPGPAYGTVVLYNANRVSLEELVRAVLKDYGRDPERWQEHAARVEEAFKVWLRLDAPYVAPADLDPDAGRAA